MSPPKRSSGIVRPQPLSWRRRAAARLIVLFLRGLTATIRFRVDIPPALSRIPASQPVIFCIWHNRLPLCLQLYNYYVRHTGRQHHMAAVVSASRDGSLIARVLEDFGVQPVRGSSSRRGAQALLEMTTWSERGFDLAVTPDGPRGPRYEVQPGIVSLAQLTGFPLVPVSYQLSWKYCLPSWDRFQIPLPFSRCIAHVGKPVFAPRRATPEEREKLRMDLQEQMRGLTHD